MEDDAAKWREMLMSGGLTLFPPKPGEWHGWPERQHSDEDMADVLQFLAEQAPIVVTEVPSSEFQFQLVTTFGTIQIYHGTMTAEVDGTVTEPAELADWFRRAGPIEVTFSYERPLLVLRAGQALIRVVPGRPESLNFWLATEPFDLLIF